MRSSRSASATTGGPSAGGGVASSSASALVGPFCECEPDPFEQAVRRAERGPMRLFGREAGEVEFFGGGGQLEPVERDERERMVRVGEADMTLE